MANLGYSTLWVEYGILNTDYFQDQENRYVSSDDKNSEHYRYQTLMNYLSAKTQLTDNEFENYLQIVYSDIDPTMAGSAAVSLFSKIELTEFQFEKLCNELCRFGDWTGKIITRQIIFRELGKGILTGKLFNDCLDSNDSVIQEYILDMLDKYQLQQLVINGANRTIKSIASNKLKKYDWDTESR